MEHRHKTRKHLFIYLKIFDQHTGELLGHLGDISKEGMMIIADAAFPLQQQWDVRMVLPDDRAFSQKFLDLQVQSRWSAPDVNPEFHCTGFLFINKAENDFTVIDKVINLLTFEEL